MSEVQRDLRFLIAQYGYESVYSNVQIIFQEDFSSLQKLLQKGPSFPEQPSAIAPAPRQAGQVSNQESADVGSISAEVFVKQPKKKEDKPVTNKQPPISQPSKISKNPTITVKKEGQEKRGRKKKLPEASPIVSPLENEEVVHPIVEQAPVESDGKFRDAKEMRAWQKQQEQKKRVELEAKGITVASLLTKENLEKWVTEDGRTYSYIAREYVGCPDAQVSAAAKTYGIQSSNSAKRIALFSHGKN
jgi:hypothetical protein